MADAYGVMILSQSEDISCDINGLVESLNRYYWNTCDTKWVANECEDMTVITMDSHGYGKVQYPSVFPEKMTGVILKNGDAEVFVENPTEDQIDNAWDFVEEDISLQELANDLVKHIKAGLIEIAYTSNEKHRYVEMGRLIIRSDGTASRHRTIVGHGYDEDLSEQI